MKKIIILAIIAIGYNFAQASDTITLPVTATQEATLYQQHSIIGIGQACNACDSIAHLADKYWSLHGNLITDGNDYIGTSNNRSLWIGTNGIDRIYIDSATGFMNIANTTFPPPSPLTVGVSSGFQVSTNGDLIRIHSIVYSWPTTQGNPNTILLNDGNGNLSWSHITNNTSYNSTYTPSVSSQQNIDSISFSLAHYHYDSGFITVIGSFTLSSTITPTMLSFQMSLPIQSSLINGYELVGTANVDTIIGDDFTFLRTTIKGNSTHIATVTIIDGPTHNTLNGVTFYYTFTYFVNP